MRYVRVLTPAMTWLVVSVVLAACATNQVATPTPPAPTTTSTAAGILSPTLIAPTPTPMVTVPALPQSRIDFLNRMTDANILEHTVSADSLEIAMARVALHRSETPLIQDYARVMIADHIRSLQHGRAVARMTNIGITMAPGDTSAMPMFALLDSLNGIIPARDFDRAYVRSQVAMHQNLLAELQTLQTVAHDADVRQHLAIVMPVVEQHLVRAQILASQIGTHH